MFPEMFEPLFCGSEKSRKIPGKFPSPDQKSHRRACAGAQEIVFFSPTSAYRKNDGPSWGAYTVGLLASSLHSPRRADKKATCTNSWVVIFFSLTEAPLTNPTPTPPNTPETDPKRTRPEPNGAEMDRNQALSGGTARGVCRGGGVGVVKGKSDMH